MKNLTLTFTHGNTTTRFFCFPDSDLAAVTHDTENPWQVTPVGTGRHTVHSPDRLDTEVAVAALVMGF